MSKMSENTVDPSKLLADARHERAARAIAQSNKHLCPSSIASIVGVQERTALKYLEKPEILARAMYLMGRRLTLAVPKALKTLEDLLSAQSEGVRLKAATELLDRVGLVARAPEQAKPAFTIELNLGDGLKTATSQRPPLNHEEFLAQGQSAKEGTGPEEDSESANKH